MLTERGVGGGEKPGSTEIKSMEKVSMLSSFILSVCIEEPLLDAQISS